MCAIHGKPEQDNQLAKTVILLTFPFLVERELHLHTTQSGNCGPAVYIASSNIAVYGSGITAEDEVFLDIECTEAHMAATIDSREASESLGYT